MVDVIYNGVVISSFQWIDKAQGVPTVEKMATEDIPGPTGQFPQGKLKADDKGELAIHLTEREGKLILNFNTPVTWLGMGRAEARDLGVKLMKFAKGPRGPSRKKDEVDRTIVEAKRAFAKHVISSGGDGRWTLRRKVKGKYEQQYWFEVVCLAGGRLMVGGDIGDVTFAYYSDTKSYEDRVRWIGGTNDLRYYVAQKATIGSGKEVTQAYSAALAAKQVETVKKNKDYDWDGDQINVMDDVLGLLEGSHGNDEVACRGAAEYLHEHLTTSDPGIFGDLGRTLAPRVVYAWQALKALVRELDKIKKMAEKKEAKKKAETARSTP